VTHVTCRTCSAPVPLNPAEMRVSGDSVEVCCRACGADVPVGEMWWRRTFRAPADLAVLGAIAVLWALLRVARRSRTGYLFPLVALVAGVRVWRSEILVGSEGVVVRGLLSPRKARWDEITDLAFTRDESIGGDLGGVSLIATLRDGGTRRLGSLPDGSKALAMLKDLQLARVYAAEPATKAGPLVLVAADAATTQTRGAT
jgi:Bacterial PH domain